MKNIFDNDFIVKYHDSIFHKPAQIAYKVLCTTKNAV